MGERYNTLIHDKSHDKLPKISTLILGLVNLKFMLIKSLSSFI